MPLNSSMTLQNAISATRTLSQAETFTANVHQRGRAPSISSSQAITLPRTILKGIAAVSAQTISLSRAMAKLVIVAGLGQNWSQTIIGTGRRLTFIVPTMTSAQSLRLIRFFSKLIIFTTAIGTAQFIKAFAIVQGQLLTLAKSVLHGIPTIAQSGKIPAMGNLGRSAIASEIIVESEIVTVSAPVRAKTFPIISSETLTLLPKTIVKFLVIGSSELITAVKSIGWIRGIVGAEFIKVGKAAGKVEAISSAETVSLIKTRSKTLLIISAETFQVFRKNLTKFILWSSAQFISCIKISPKQSPLLSMASAQLVNVLFPLGRQQNLLATMLSGQSWAVQAITSHFATISILSSQAVVAVKSFSKLPFTWANIIGAGPVAAIFTAPALNSSKTVSATSFRQIIPIDQITSVGNQIQLTFSNAIVPSAGACQIVQCFIGPQAIGGNDYDFASTPTQITFAGQAIGIVPLRGTLQSDFIPLTLTTSAPLVVAVDIASANAALDQAINTADPGFRVWSKPYSGNQAQSAVGPSGMTQTAAALWGISAISGQQTNVSVSRALSKIVTTIASSEFVQLLRTPPGKVFAITQAATITLLKQKAKNQLAQISSTLSLTLSRIIGQYIAFGPVLWPQQFSPAFTVSSNINQVARQVIPASEIATYTSSPIQVTFSNLFGANACRIVAAYIGEQSQAGGGDAAFDGNQIQLTVRGQASFTIPKGGTVTTDLAQLTLANGVPIIVSWEFSAGANSLDALAGQDPGFHYWAGGPSGSAGGTAMPPAMAQTLGMIAGVASIGAPQLVGIGKGISRSITATAAQFLAAIKTAMPIETIANASYLLIGPNAVSKMIGVAQAQLVIALRTTARKAIAATIGQIISSGRVIAPIEAISSPQSVSNLMQRSRMLSILQGSLASTLKGINKAFPIMESLIVVLPQFANHFQRAFMIVGVQLLSANNGISRATYIVQAQVVSCIRTLSHIPTLIGQSQSASLIKTIGHGIGIIQGNILTLFKQAGGRVQAIVSSQLIQLTIPPKFKIVSVIVGQAQNFALLLPSKTQKLLLSITQSQRMTAVRDQTIRIYRVIAGIFGSRNIEPGGP